MSYSPSEDRPAGTVEMTMPETGSTEAAVVAWLKRPGERVAEGEPVCLVAWDGVTAEVTSPATGVMRMVALATGHPAPTGTSLAVIDTAVLPTRKTEEPEPLRVPDSALREAPVADLEPVDPAPTETRPTVIDTAVLPTPQAEEPEPLRVPDSALREAPVADLEPVDLGGYLSPAVRRFSAEHGIDPHSVAGTGRDGRVTLRDLGR